MIVINMEKGIMCNHENELRLMSKHNDTYKLIGEYPIEVHKGDSLIVMYTPGYSIHRHILDRIEQPEGTTDFYLYYDDGSCAINKIIWFLGVE